MNKFASDLAISFLMYCDSNNFTVEQGEGLAEKIAEAVYGAAQDRDQYADREIKSP